MGEECACLRIQNCDRAHIFLGQTEIEDVHVLDHSFLMGGFRQDDHAPLDVPAQHHLCRGLCVLPANVFQCFIFEQPSPAGQPYISPSRYGLPGAGSAHGSQSGRPVRPVIIIERLMEQHQVCSCQVRNKNL